MRRRLSGPHRPFFVYFVRSIRAHYTPLCFTHVHVFQPPQMSLSTGDKGSLAPTIEDMETGDHPTPGALWRTFEWGDLDVQEQALRSAPTGLLPEACRCHDCGRQAYHTCDSHFGMWVDGVRSYRYMCDKCVRVDPSGTGLYCAYCVTHLDLVGIRCFTRVWQNLEARLDNEEQGDCNVDDLSTTDK